MPPSASGPIAAVAADEEIKQEGPPRALDEESNSSDLSIQEPAKTLRHLEKADSLPQQQQQQQLSQNNEERPSSRINADFIR